MVRLENITIRRRGRVILGPISTTLPDKGVTCLIGRNGSGKSTFLRLLNGLERPKTGELHWDHPIDRLAESFLFQTPIVLRRTVQANLELPLQLRGKDLTPVLNMADRFGLVPYLTQPAHLLSGGELQRLALARALITNPKRIYMDEPTANLDRATTVLVEQTINELATAGVQIILSTHSARQLERIGDTVLFLNAGHAESLCPVSDFLANPPSDASRDWLVGD